MRKSIKNYTSEVPVNRSLQNIQDILARAGAQKIMMDYDSTRNVSAIVFGLEIEGKGFVPFTLPVNVEKLATVLYKTDFNRLDEKRKEQARRTAWKNVHDWIDAQMALIETEMVEVGQVFLPYVVTGQNKTLYDSYMEGRLLPPGTS